MRCRHRQTSRYFWKSPHKTGNHTLNHWHHIAKIPENLKAQPKQTGIYQDTFYTTVTLPIRFKSGLISKENAHHISTLPWSVLRRKALISERKLNHATDIWYMWHFRMPSKCRKHRQIPHGFSTWSRAWQLSNRAIKLLVNSVYHWRGHWLKSVNQNFNCRRAVLLSELTKGLDSTKSMKTSARLNRISKKRACRINDFFIKQLTI